MGDNMAQAATQSSSGSPATSSRAEGRVFARLACDLSTSCQPTSAWGQKDARWPATIHDISLGGVQLIVPRRFEPGSGLGIELPAHDGGEPSLVLARIIHVHALPDGTWSLGCKFISELGEDELQGLLALQNPPPEPQPPTELSPPPVIPSHLPAAPPGPQTLQPVDVQLELPDGRIVDCHLRRLSIPALPVAGQALTIRLNSPRGSRPALRVEVIGCSRRDGRWVLRGRLLSPSWELLQRAVRRPG